MGLFDTAPAEPLRVALRRHWLPFALLAVEPLVAFVLAAVFPGTPFLRALTAPPAVLLALWPTAFRRAPVSYWLLCCAAWFAVGVVVLAFSGGVGGA